jgi:hypothetical protein
VKWLAYLLLSTPLCGSAGGASPQACAPCHRAETAAFTEAGMTKALESAEECAILKANPRLTVRIGGYFYQIDRVGKESFYSVTDGKDTIRIPVEWAFGQGAAGQTYLFQRGGRWYESRVSYYSAIKGLDTTIGSQDTTAQNLDEAAGRLTAANEPSQCFNCHATHAVAKRELTLPAMLVGIRCERCHGDSDRHLAAVRTGDSAKAGMRKLGALSTEDLSDFCGECHRTWSQIAMSGPRGIRNVRFQPYRLQSSRCYDAEDRRIRCTACHDPHADVRTDPASYDANCKACHSAGAKPATTASSHLCRVATKGCVTCHMPQVELPGAHKKFYDHEIRIARANEKYPD